MANPRTRLRDSRSLPLRPVPVRARSGLLAWALASGPQADWQLGVAALLAVPLVVAGGPVPDGPRRRGRRHRDRLRLEHPDVPAVHLRRLVRLAVWGLGVLATQLTSGKRPTAQLFNIGVGLLAARRRRPRCSLGPGRRSGRRASCWPWSRPRGRTSSSTTCCLAVSISIDSATPVRGHLVQPRHLARHRLLRPLRPAGLPRRRRATDQPLVDALAPDRPAVTLLVSTRAIARGRENARRLTVLLEAAVRVQSLHESGQIIEALLHDARRLVRMRDVEVRIIPPGPYEIGAQVQSWQGAAVGGGAGP